MFDRKKAKTRQSQEKQEQRDSEERNRLLSLSEKELLVEILMSLKDIDARLSDVENNVRFMMVQSM